MHLTIWSMSARDGNPSRGSPKSGDRSVRKIVTHGSMETLHETRDGEAFDSQAERIEADEAMVDSFCFWIFLVSHKHVGSGILVLFLVNDDIKSALTQECSVLN